MAAGMGFLGISVVCPPLAAWEGLNSFSGRPPAQMANQWSEHTLELVHSFLSMQPKSQSDLTSFMKGRPFFWPFDHIHSMEACMLPIKLESFRVCPIQPANIYLQERTPHYIPPKFSERRHCFIPGNGTPHPRSIMHQCPDE